MTLRNTDKSAKIRRVAQRISGRADSETSSEEESNGGYSDE